MMHTKFPKSPVQLGAMVALLILGVAAATVAAPVEDNHASAERRSMRVESRTPFITRSSGAWQTMLRFNQPVTYEYKLWRQSQGHSTQGSLTMQVSSSSVAVTYEVNGVRDGFVWGSAVSTLGEALMSALLVSDKWSDGDIRLIWTPFMVTRWASQFAQIEWRVGPGWAVRSGSSEQFSIDQVLRDSRDNTIFRGSLVQSGRRVLDIDINLNLPLPEYICWTDKSGDQYEAELIWNQPSSIPSIVGK